MSMLSESQASTILPIPLSSKKSELQCVELFSKIFVESEWPLKRLLASSRNWLEASLTVLLACQGHFS